MAAFLLVGALASVGGATETVGQSSEITSEKEVNKFCPIGSYEDPTDKTHCLTRNYSLGLQTSDTFACGWVWVSEKGRSELQIGSHGSTCYYEQDGKLVTYTG